MNFDNKTPCKRRFFTTVVGTALFFSAGFSWSRGEVTEVSISSEPVTPVSYIEEGSIYTWGGGHNLIINGFTYQDQRYVFDADTVETVKIQRVDNGNVKGKRCSFYTEVEGEGFNYAPAFPGDVTKGHCDLEKAISDNVINVDPLDVFSNDDSRSYLQNNIERIDYITQKGISAGSTTAKLNTSGVAVLEKSGNNSVKVAAIVALDGDGHPNAYGPLITIEPSWEDAGSIRYGITEIGFQMHYLSNELLENPGNVKFRASSDEFIGLAFVSQKDLGLAAGQTYFGFSIFPADVDVSVHSLTDPATFPRNTSPINFGPGDADFSAASAFLVLNNAPTANDDTATTLESQPVTIDILANDSDPDGDALAISVISGPQHGSVSIVNNELVYTPEDGYTGSDSITYQIDDGNGGRDTATVLISVGTGNGSPVANDDQDDTDINQAVAIDILENDSDPDGDKLSVTLLGQPENGTAEWNGSELIYTPDNGFSGIDSLQYEVSDGNGGSDTATVNLSVATVLAGASGRIETGLNGHGAGSLNAIMLFFLGVVGLFRTRGRNNSYNLG